MAVKLWEKEKEFRHPEFYPDDPKTQPFAVPKSTQKVDVVG
jgi:hypothetical protein